MALKKKNTETGNDPNDVSQIYNDYQAELKGYISKRVSFKEDVEDILQNVFYQLARVDLVENPIEQISSWLYSVARNQIIDRSRKKREEKLPQYTNDNEDDFILDISEILTDEGNTPEIAYFQSLVWEELDIALNELPEEQRVVFELTELEGFSYKEISGSTGIPVNTLISRKHYAVIYLRECLKELYDEILG